MAALSRAYRMENCVYYEPQVLSNTFSEWAELTVKYAQGMEALRRREPGASVRMMELSAQMQRLQARVMGGGDELAKEGKASAGKTLATRAHTSWFGETLKTLLGYRRQPQGRGQISYQ
jgi:hypothetical protein